MWDHGIITEWVHCKLICMLTWGYLGKTALKVKLLHIPPLNTTRRVTVWLCCGVRHKLMCCVIWFEVDWLTLHCVWKACLPACFLTESPVTQQHKNSWMRISKEELLKKEHLLPTLAANITGQLINNIDKEKSNACEKLNWFKHDSVHANRA